jgi:hypothetical protein
MATYTIDSENNITAPAALPAGVDDSLSFSSQEELAALAAEWPVSRLVGTWNSFAGVAPFDDLTPVRKFTNRAVAVARIYKAVQRLSAHVAQPAADDASASLASKKSPAKKKQRYTARTSANSPAARDGSKKAEVIELMGRKSGAALDEIMKLTGWQPHTVRGFVSGTLLKKMGLNVESFRTEQNGRCYRILREHSPSLGAKKAVAR